MRGNYYVCLLYSLYPAFARSTLRLQCAEGIMLLPEAGLIPSVLIPPLLRLRWDTSRPQWGRRRRRITHSCNLCNMRNVRNVIKIAQYCQIAQFCVLWKRTKHVGTLPTCRYCATRSFVAFINEWGRTGTGTGYAHGAFPPTHSGQIYIAAFICSSP